MKINCLFISSFFQIDTDGQPVKKNLAYSKQTGSFIQRQGLFQKDILLVCFILMSYFGRGRFFSQADGLAMSSSILQGAIAYSGCVCLSGQRR